MAKTAIISDIHSNLAALQAVLAECKKLKVKKFVCLGDIVGYGAHPAECLDIVRSLDCPTVKGNHDQSVGEGKPHPDMNSLAAAGITYSVHHLSKDNRNWLARLPVQIDWGQATLVHSSLIGPLEWPYITEAFEAEESMAIQKTPVCFYGHTHRPRMFARRTTVPPEKVGLMKFRLAPKGRCMVNPGSVGQPRGGDWRAHFAVYDPRELSVEFFRVTYDVEAEAKSILRAGLPDLLAERIRIGY